MNKVKPDATIPGQAYPEVRFAVMSDLHFFAAELAKPGTALDSATEYADTMFVESEALLELAISEILKADVQFVLIPGDLTKDGEAESHQQLPTRLARLAENGVQVYVIPGNHDMNNPRSYRYEGDQRILSENISPEKFAELYAPYGYDQAILRDEGSLSYAAELTEGLWLIAVDCTRSRFNKPGCEEIVAGRLTPATRDWLRNALQQARNQQKKVLYMQHHGVVEHWQGQAKLHPDFIVEDFGAIGRILAAGGVRLAFTGHYHALDITRADFGDDGFLYDIETGSLAAPPCAVRICSLSGNQLKLTSLRLAELYQPEPGFAERAGNVIRESVRQHTIKAARAYKVPVSDADYIADQIAAAYQAHYYGDENPALRPAFSTKRLSLWGKLVYQSQKYIIENLWRDLPPADDNITLEL